MDMLDKYMLSPQATEEYLEHCKEIAHILLLEGIEPEDAEDEKIAEIYDDKLEIYAMINGIRYSFFVDSEDWIVNPDWKVAIK